MKYYVGVTDDEWFHFLASKKPDEVNFCLPKAKTAFIPLPPGAPFLFKLPKPNNFIVGGGYFVKFSVLALSTAWMAFGNNNGSTTMEECRLKILKNRKTQSEDDQDPKIGCVILTEPFFFERTQWITAPAFWEQTLISGKTYDTGNSMEAFRLWEDVKIRLAVKDDKTLTAGENAGPELTQPAEIYKDFSQPRDQLGPGAFWIVVMDAYQRQCAISGEKTGPVLEASYIKPFSEGGINHARNGILLRADLRILFEKGYLTVDPELKVLVSPRIKREFENGKDYYAYHGKELRFLPEKPEEKPSSEFLKWHNENRFLS